MLATIVEAFPELELIGCTTDGEFSSERGFSEDSAVLRVLAGDDVRVASGVARHVSTGPEAAIRASLEEASRRLGDSPKFCLTTPTRYDRERVSDCARASFRAWVGHADSSAAPRVINGDLSAATSSLAGRSCRMRCPLRCWLATSGSRLRCVPVGAHLDASALLPRSRAAL